MLNCVFIMCKSSYRYLGKLKRNVKNKNKVEGSIANAYVMEETASFCSFYFEEHVKTKATTMARNADTYVVQDDYDQTLSIFRTSGRPLGEAKSRWLTSKEYEAAQSYVLLNCEEVEAYTTIFDE